MRKPKSSRCWRIMTFPSHEDCAALIQEVEAFWKLRANAKLRMRAYALDGHFQNLNNRLQPSKIFMGQLEHWKTPGGRRVTGTLVLRDVPLATIHIERAESTLFRPFVLAPDQRANLGDRRGTWPGTTCCQRGL